MPMKIFVKAKPGAKQSYIKEDPAGLFDGNGKNGRPSAVPERRFVVAVTERAIQGRANDAIVRALAEYFHVPRAAVRIVAGTTAKEKIVEIGDAA
jgi:uncharacterized protein YggU (UPF0235/DUF167 family)